MTYQQDFNLFIGGKTGILKGNSFLFLDVTIRCALCLNTFLAPIFKILIVIFKIIVYIHALLIVGLQVNNENLIVKNLHNVKNLSSGSEITALSWGDPTEMDILIGTKDQSVKVYDSEFKAFTSCMKTRFGEGPIVGLTRFNK